MSEATDRLRHMDTWSEELIETMLDVIDAADKLVQGVAWPSTVSDLDALDDALTRLHKTVEPHGGR